MRDTSQKVKILNVAHAGGEVYIGDDRYGNPMYTKDPARVMEWLCDGWRCRFNECRAQRYTWKPATDAETGEKLHDADGGLVWEKKYLARDGLRPLLKVKDDRADKSWLACMPAPVIESCSTVEYKEWDAAAKRRKTLKAKGKKPGRWPGFKSRKTHDQTFVCWRNQNKSGNAILSKANRRSAVVTVSGMTDSAHKRGKQPAHWQVRIVVRVTEEIRPYTSVRVNWTRRELVFVNEPLPVRDPGVSVGHDVGIDLGVVHTMATDVEDDFRDIPQATDSEVRRYRKLQRKLARQDRVNKERHEADPENYPDFRESKRRKQTLSEMERIRSRVARRKDDWCQQQTTEIVRANDLIAVEALRVDDMTARCAARPDPDRPGRWLANGQSAKSKLNRAILSNEWGKIRRYLEHKAERAGATYVEVPAAYSSQTCSGCGYTYEGNRESQAVFSCKECGLTLNADTNAARNHLARARRMLADMETDVEDGADGPVAGRGGKPCGADTASRAVPKQQEPPNHAERDLVE